MGWRHTTQALVMGLRATYPQPRLSTQRVSDRWTYCGNMVDIEQPKKKAAGVPAVLSSFKFGFREMGPVRTGKVFLKMNQDGGFDCPSCAWPDPDHKRKHAAEFCENGAKAVAWEATRKRVPRDFFATHSVDRADRDLRVRARQARPDHRADAAASRRDPLRAGRLGRGRSRSSPGT